MEPTGKLLRNWGRVPTLTFIEDEFSPIPAIRLGNEEYGRGLQRFIAACADIVPINKQQKTIYLARRRSKPITGWWWIGGGALPNETWDQAAIRNFERETGIRLTADRLVLRANIDYFLKDRQQDPQTIGCHTDGKTFSVELAHEELKAIRLDPDEYEDGELLPFSRQDLVAAGAFPTVLALYDLIFPPAKTDLWHVVLISFKPDASEEIRQQIYDRYQTLGADCGGRDAGILFWKVSRNLDTRKNVHLVEIAIFENNEALQTFRCHPKHRELTDILCKIADWQVGDANLVLQE